MQFPAAQLIRSGIEVSNVHRLRHTLETWIRSCGPEWTVDRIKTIKNVYVQRLAGHDVPMPPFIAIDPQGNLKGVFKCVFALKKPRKILDALMVYTGIKVNKVTVRQRRKFFRSVESPPVEIPEIPNLNIAIQEVNGMSPDYISQGINYRQYPFSGTKSCPGVTTEKSAKNLPERLVDDFRTSAVWDVLDDDDCEWVLSDTLDNLYRPLFKVPEDIDDPFMGRISVIQERGCKARFIANPRLTFQIGSLPLGKHLFEVCRRIPWDCTHDQKSGATWGENKLTTGKLWCVDLSDFTNNFPFALILRILEAMAIPLPDRRYLSKVTQGRWRVPQYLHPKKREVQWTKGMPLGFYPCFPAAAIAHGLLLRSLEITYNVSDTFRVLGDDVIISNGLIHWAYRRLLDRLQCPVSEEKTLVRGRIGEFAGYIITKQGSYRPNKVIFPTPDNRGERIVRDYVHSVGDLTTPYRLIAYAIHGLPLAEKQLGLPLRDRAALRRLVTQTTDCLITLNNPESKVILNRVVQRLFELYPDMLGALTREEVSEIQGYLNEITCKFRDLDDQLIIDDQPMPLRLAIYHRMPSIRVLDTWYKEMNHKFRDTEPTWSQMTQDFSQFVTQKSPRVHKAIRQAVKKQIADFKKSKSIIDGELISFMLDYLTS